MQEYDAMESWMDDPVLPNIKTNNVINVSWPERLLSATTGVALIGSACGISRNTRCAVLCKV